MSEIFARSESSRSHATTGPGEPACCGSVAPAQARSFERRGRRIYLHENALVHLARQNPCAASLVFETLAQIAIRKTLFHQVEQDGVVLGTISPEGARRLAAAIDGDGAEVASRCLHTISYKPENGAARPLPLQESQEQIAGTCYFDQHYAFATSEEMANVMYLDDRSLKEMRRLRESGEDYQDLVLVSGPRLLLEPKDGRPRPPLTPAESARVRMAALRNVRDHLLRMLDSVELGEKERSFVTGKVDQALAAAFSHGALKTI